MNFECSNLLVLLDTLEKAMGNVTGEQSTLFEKLRNEITEMGQFYEVTALTIPLMREHGYDVTDVDCGTISKIAEHIEVNSDELWNAVEIWANEYNVKRIEED